MVRLSDSVSPAAMRTPRIPLDELTPEDRREEILRLQREHDKALALREAGWREYTADEIVNSNQRGSPDDLASLPWNYLLQIAKSYNSECCSHFKLGPGAGKIYYRDEVWGALVKNGIFHPEDDGYPNIMYHYGYPPCPEGPLNFAWKLPYQLFPRGTRNRKTGQRSWKQWHPLWIWAKLLLRFLRKLQKESNDQECELRGITVRDKNSVPLSSWRDFYAKLDDALNAKEKIPDFYMPPPQKSPMHDMIAGGIVRRRLSGPSFLRMRFQEVGDYGYAYNGVGI